MKIERETMSTKIYTHIKNSIVSGVLSPGDQLKETWVAKDLEVSATPVREAFKLLESEGFLESIPYRGVRVKQHEKADYNRAYIIRAKMESAALRFVMEDADDDMKQTLFDIIEQAKGDQTTPSLKRFIRFHDWIIRHSKTDIIFKTLSSIHAMINSDILMKEFGTINEEKHIQNHLALFDSIEKWDIEAAERKIENLIRQQGKEFLSF
ncbi:MAG: GntR family transcriptional regulator [Clostridia bacterium]|nr:GntR family transcriptional regulator [Clostridia bacterium]